MATQAHLITARFPVLTLVICAGALIIFIVPGLGALLIFDRVAIAHGEVWRLITGNLVHHSTPHLIYDLTAFMIVGTIIEILGYRYFPLLCFSVAILTGLAIFRLEPAIYFYGGISGIVTAASTFLCLHGLFDKGMWRWLCAAILTGMTAKVGVELILGKSFLLAVSMEPFVPVPLIHLVGYIAALFLFVAMRVLNNHEPKPQPIFHQ